MISRKRKIILLQITIFFVALFLLYNTYRNKDDIIDVHDLHIWEINVGKPSMSVHIKSKKPLKTLANVTDLCRRKYDLFHTTIQVEGAEDPESNPH